MGRRKETTLETAWNIPGGGARAGEGGEAGARPRFLPIDSFGLRDEAHNIPRGGDEKSGVEAWVEAWRPDKVLSTRGPSCGHHSVVLGAIVSFLEPFCVHLSPKK